MLFFNAMIAIAGNSDLRSGSAAGGNALALCAITGVALVSGWYTLRKNKHPHHHSLMKTRMHDHDDAATVATKSNALSSNLKTKTAEKEIVTSLTTKRGSEWMNLPSELSPATIDIIAATAPVVAPKALDITRTFYHGMFAKHPELLQYFNPSHNVPVSLHQPKALAASIVAYASNIRDLSVLTDPLKAIAHRHCALAVHPAQYQVVHDNVMAAIAKTLGGAVTPEIANAWSEAILYLAKVLIDMEEALYQESEQRHGGWSGPMDFNVSNIEDAGTEAKRITFVPVNGSPILKNEDDHNVGFEFTPGQYLSLQLDLNGDGRTAPRHYTITSPPGAKYLQCIIKKVPGGNVSTYVHEKLQVGETVKLLPPYGIFTVEDPSMVDSAVLMSAGIGATPMINIHRALGNDKVRLAVHVDGSPDTQPVSLEDMTKQDCTYQVYTRIPGGKGRPTAAALVDETLKRAGGTAKDHVFYVCGPNQWMDDVQAELLKRAAKEVKCEVFGSQMATGCPFSAAGANSSAGGGCPFMMAS